MECKGQSSFEWLVTHAWSILIVLCVSAVLFYAGVFEMMARPRFEGLAALGLQPIPEQVHLYSDGVMVFTVLNTRPYSHQLEWVEVAPIADKNNVIQTIIDTTLNQGEINTFQINATNLLSQITAASILIQPQATAKTQLVDFHICIKETYSVGGQPRTHTVCGKAWNIEVIDKPYDSSCETPWSCPCESDSDCPLVCQICYMPGLPADESYCNGGALVGGCVEKSIETGIPHECKSTAAHPEGECVPLA